MLNNQPLCTNVSVTNFIPLDADLESYEPTFKQIHERLAQLFGFASKINFPVDMILRNLDVYKCQAICILTDILSIRKIDLSRIKIKISIEIVSNKCSVYAQYMVVDVTNNPFFREDKPVKLIEFTLY